jgi:hypothetical protein
MHRHGTILVIADTSKPAFDLAFMRYSTYHLEGGRLSDDSARQLADTIARALRALAQAEQVDSPIFELFPGYSASMPPEVAPRTRGGHGVPERMRRQLLEATKHPDLSSRLVALREVEQAVLGLATPDPVLVSDLLIAYRDASAWSEVVRLADALPTSLRERPLVRQQLAMALNRRNGPGDRERAIALLEDLASKREDSEVLGLLGRIHKDLYRETNDPAHLDRAIDAYRRGHRATSDDYYPGVNLATLLWTKGTPPAREELAEILPELQVMLDRQAASGRVDYWNVATRIEIACLSGAWERARALVLEARLRAPAPWMAETTAANLRLLARSGGAQEKRQLHEIAAMLVEGTGGAP